MRQGRVKTSLECHHVGSIFGHSFGTEFENLELESVAGRFPLTRATRGGPYFDWASRERRISGRTPPSVSLQETHPVGVEAMG